MSKIILILLIISILSYFFFRRAKTKIGRNENILIERCFGDRDKAERLINFEQKRNPSLSREEAAKNAMLSLLRDNR